MKVCVRIALAAILLITSVSVAQESSVVVAMLEEAGGSVKALDEIIIDHEALLDKYPDSDFAAPLLFQLAELHYERAQLIFQQQMVEYEQRLADFNAGKETVEPQLPALDLSRTIALCSRLLGEFSKLPFREKAIYKLAVAYMDGGAADSSAIWFDRLVAEFPDSPPALEAHFRIGEHHFERREFEQAVGHYKLLLNQWDNPYYSMSLYKLGWSYYNLQRYSDAISTFLVLIEDASLTAKLKSSPLAQKTDLTTEAIHYIADSFTEFGGPEAAKKFLAPLREKPYSAAVLTKMAQLYESRSFFQQAIDVYRALLEFYPFAAQAPDNYRSIVGAYEAAQDVAAANQVREEAVRVFGPGGVWAQRHPQGELYQEGLRLTREHLVFLGTFYQARARADNTSDDYRRAIEKYQQYVDQFPDQENSSEIHYYLAESFYAGGDFARAAEAYQQVVERYPHSVWREKAAFNRIFSNMQRWQREDAGNDSLRIPHFLNTAETVSLAGLSTADVAVLTACNDFCRTFPNSELIDQVLMTYGQVLYERRAFLAAVQAYTQVMNLEAGPHRNAAAINAGRAFFDGGYFEQARDWFSEIARTIEDAPTAEQAQRMAASAQFKIAEELSRDGKTIDAASMLLTAAAFAPDTLFQARALFEAALQYQKADSLLNAARTFEQLAMRHSTSELADRALYQAGAMRERLGDWALAAADYRLLAENYPDSPLRQQAFKNAVLCYENAQDWSAAKNISRRFVETFPDSADDVIEFSYKSGDMAQRAGQPQEAGLFFQDVIERYEAFVRQGLSPDAYFAAGAQFMLGEIAFADYQNIALAPPFESNLRRKMTAFTEVVQSYGDAAKHQIADWSTASLYRIGESFEELVRALTEAPVPEGLNEEQRLLYQQALAERVRPYQEKALETYQRNLEQAAASTVDNQWVAASRERAEALRLMLFAEPQEISQTQEGQ